MLLVSNLKILCPTLGLRVFSLHSFYTRFIVLCFTFNSIINFQLIFVLYMRFRWHLFFAYECLILPAPYVEKVSLLPLSCLGTCLKYQVAYLYESISGFSILFHWSLCYRSASTTLSLFLKLYVLTLGRLTLPTLISVLQNCFLGPLPVNINIRISLSMSTKYPCWAYTPFLYHFKYYVYGKMIHTASRSLSHCRMKPACVCQVHL